MCIRSSIKYIVVSRIRQTHLHCEKLGVSLCNANLGESETIYWLEWKDASSSESKQKTKFCNPNKLVIQG